MATPIPDLVPPPPPDRFEQAVRFLMRHWLLWLNTALGLYAALPWLSPLLRLVGWDAAGQALFRLYTPLCHQRPDFSYTLGGYQVAYCQRDTAIYTAIFLAGLLFGLLRRRLKPWPWWALGLSMLPLALDGLTQLPRAFLPDWPLRTENTWAVFLTGGLLPHSFYAGDSVGSLNWLLRTISGALFGVGLVSTLYPMIEAELRRGERRRYRQNP